MLDLVNHKLGATTEDIVLNSMEDNRAVGQALIAQADRSLEIFSRDLEARLYDNSDFTGAVRAMVLRSQHTRVRILVNEPDYAIKHDHRLIYTARHLSSYIEIRKTHEDYAMNPAAFLLVDQRGLLYRTVATHHDGIASFNNPSRVGELLRFFNEAWNHSRQYTEFRRLYI
jgi:hypothetical protein